MTVKPTKDQQDNARIGYQVAAQLWAYEGQGLWSAFNAMLVANSIVVAAEAARGFESPGALQLTE
jgi:hypothetical protein